jgi:type VI protein secretion system component VasK
MDDAANKLGILSSNRSPLLAVLMMVSDNTMLSKTPASGSEQIGDKVRHSVQTGFRRFFPKAKEAERTAKMAASPEDGARLSQTDIFNVFQPVRTLVTAGNRDRLVSDPNRAYINSLAGLQTALEALPRQRDARLDVSMNAGARQALDKGHAAVREAAQRFNINTAQGVDTELTRFLEMPLEFAERYVPRDPNKPLRDRVNGQMRALCNKLGALQRKFPFNPQADTEVTEQDLAAVFAPNIGALWSFEQLPPPLAGLLIKQGESWIQNPAVPQPRLTPEFIDFFNRMAAVSTALYPGATSKPSLHYTVQPLETEGAQAMRINIGGTLISSTGKPVQVSWPPPAGSSFVDLQLVMNGLSIPFGRYEGQWAIFRLMQDGDPQPPGSSVYIFRNLRQGHGKPQQVTNTSGDSVSVRLMIQFPGRFDPRTFRARCPMVAAK